MRSQSGAFKRKANAPVSGDKNKVARTSNSRDASTSKRQAPADEPTTDKGTEKENVGEPTGRAVRTNRGQGGHAYQLENALNPIMKDQAHKTNEGIPENIPENAMAPQVSRKEKKGDSVTKTAPKLPRSEAMLPRVGPEPIFQMALKDSRFGFSARDSNSTSNLPQNVSNQGQRPQANQYNPNHRKPVLDSDIKGDNDVGDTHSGSSGDDDDGDRNDGDDDSNNVNNGDDDENAEDIYANPDMEIDEASPSEDEAAAQDFVRALHYEGLHNLQRQDAIDVLEDHRTRNHAMRPPNLDIPANTAIGDVNQPEDDGDSNDNEAKDDESSTQRARRYSKTPRDAEPKSTTMKYYPPGWQAMIEMAKNNMRKHVALVNAFPRRDRDLKEATLILNNAITEYQRIEGNTLEPGYSPDRDMSILVFNEHSSFRQKLKKVIQRVLLAKYGDLLSPPDFEGGNQQEVYEFVQKAVHKSLKDGLFLRGGEDENGKCKNLAHPAIPAVIHEFFYTDKDCLAALYRQDFEHVVPDHAIALVMTCIQNCLEEYTDLGYRKTITIDGDTYRAVIKHYLHLIDTLKGHEYHGVRYEARRTGWARKGMQLLERDEAPVARYAPTLQLD